MTDQNYSKFYHHNVDMDGCPFIKVDNPVITILGLKAQREAIASALCFGDQRVDKRFVVGRLHRVGAPVS